LARLFTAQPVPAYVRYVALCALLPLVWGGALVGCAKDGPPGIGTLVGCVRDAETGEPLVGARVTYLGELVASAEATESRETVLRAGPVSATGADGRFRIENVPCGDARLRVELAGYWTETVKGVKLLGETTSDIAVTLLRTDADRTPVSGVVRDDNGQPIEGVSVACAAERAVTDSDGAYRIRVPEVAEGTQVTFTRAGYAAATEILDAWRLSEPVVRDVVLARLRSGVVAGIAFDAHDGARLEGVRVELEDGGAFCVTGASGAFRLEGVPLGETTVVFTASGYRAERRTVTVDGETEVHVPLVAPSVGAIVAMARHERTGEPLAGVEVTTRPLGRTALTDGSGVARFEHVPPGEYALRFYLRDFGETTEGPVTVSDLEWPEVVADLQPTRAGLSGTLSTPDGAPAPGWRLFLTELGGPTVGAVLTDALGRFEAHDLAVPEPSRTLVILPEGAPATAQVALTPGRTADSGPLTLVP